MGRWRPVFVVHSKLNVTSNLQTFTIDRIGASSNRTRAIFLNKGRLPRLVA
jgi:hypothetical protein